MPDEIRLKSFSSRPQTYHTPEKLELLGKIGIVASVGLALSAVITLAKKYHAEPTATAPRTPFFSTSY